MFRSRPFPFVPPGWCAGLLLLLLSQAALAAQVKITQAVYDEAAQQLKVATETRAKNGTLSLLHGEGGLLDEQSLTGTTQQFTVPLTRLGQVPCEVEAWLGQQHAIAPVTGAPARCATTPTCKILAPKDGQTLALNELFNFQGKVKLRDPQAKRQELSYEWDFGGGSMGVAGPGATPNSSLRPTTLGGTSYFVRGDSVYRIRFSATDAQQRRCEAAVTVKVGNPPAGLPAKVADLPVDGKSMPMRGSENNGAENDIVVLPFEDWSMQNQSDARMLVNGSYPFNAKHSNLRAHVIRKGSVGGAKPAYLSDSRVRLQYGAASNPLDPVGAGSINSTSQNWPVGAAFDAAQLKKSDWWDTWSGRADADKVDTELNHGLPYISYSFMGNLLYMQTRFDAKVLTGPGPDEGLPFDPVADLRTSTMPGKSDPYQVNNPVDFSGYERSNQWFEANEIPITDVDDQGRVNPYPLLRVQAVDRSTGKALAATDTVLSNSRDFHCRECHAEGGIAAQPTGRSAKACQYSPWDLGYLYTGLTEPSTYCTHDPKTGQPRTDPDIFPAQGLSGQASARFDDQEYAALKNASSLHQFYDGSFASTYVEDTRGQLIDQYLWGHRYASPDGKTLADGPSTCAWDCHWDRFNKGTAATAGQAVIAPGVSPSHWSEHARSNDQTGMSQEYSWTMHAFHAQLQYNADRTGILRHQGEANQARYPDGSIKRWDFANGPNNSTKTGSLFPIFDDQGQQLPMEQNCLRCHAGHREPLYRDRMETAGRTCYDCHGDMGAVGQAFMKPAGLSEGATNRTSWNEQPDCAACHTGNGNQGQDAKNGFYSAGVHERAFDDQVLNPATGQTEPNYAATPRRPDLVNPDSARFAVVQTALNDDPATRGGVVYRLGKDQHGYTGCPACHGAAHGVGPNRDPKANDNLASIELQGYPGPVYECQVCHTRDAFNTEASMGSALHYPDAAGEGTILAGPHNLHPVNDPNWYQHREGGAPNQDGTTYGGWHNVWSGKPGLNGEDQCAACHGADHRGTRLSKTPVDRVFDFSGLDFAKLQAAGFKSAVVRVKAGTPIGCDTCHSLDTSTRHTPTGPVTQRSTPVILPPKTPEFILADGNTPFRYQIPAKDAEGDNLSFTVEDGIYVYPEPWYGSPVASIGPESGLKVSADGLVTWPVPNVTGSHPFRVKVTDSSGGVAERWYWVNLQNCAKGVQMGAFQCTDIAFTAPGPDITGEFGTGRIFGGGVNAGETWTYAFKADSPNHRALRYSLAQYPGYPVPGALKLGASNGALSFPTVAGGRSFEVFYVVASDGKGQRQGLLVTLSVCQPPSHWDAEGQSCGGGH